MIRCVGTWVYALGAFALRLISPKVCILYKSGCENILFAINLRAAFLRAGFILLSYHAQSLYNVLKLINLTNQTDALSRIVTRGW